MHSTAFPAAQLSKKTEPIGFLTWVWMFVFHDMKALLPARFCCRRNDLTERQGKFKGKGESGRDETADYAD